MSSLTQAIPGSMAEILARVKISEVYSVLTGKQPQPVGPNAWRGPAVWRGGDGHNVSMNDTRNVWHDFTANEGGGSWTSWFVSAAAALASGLRRGPFGQPTAVSHGTGRLGEATAAD